jgi:hypothetical protein
MEVHHHAHSSRKKWTHYFWEFLMLFLAVFCGFLAEYKLEHTIEHQREKQYMTTMLEDLKSDTALLSFAMRYWDTINHSIDSVADAVDPTLTTIDQVKAYNHLNSAFNYFSFSPNDRTISQLKNSGGFRVIRDKEVANKIILLDQLNNDAMVNIANQHNFFYETVVKLRNRIFVQEVINRLFNEYRYKPAPQSAYSRMDSMIKNAGIPSQPGTQQAMMFEFKNALLAYRQDYYNMIWGYNSLKSKMDELIMLVEKNYRLHEN